MSRAAVQSVSGRTFGRKSPRPDGVSGKIPKAASRQTIVWLQTNWKAVEANLGEIEVSYMGIAELDGRFRRSESALARLAHASQILGRPVSSFNDLSQSEADRLVLAYKQELGEEYRGPGYQGARRWSRKRPRNMLVDGLMITKLGEIAAELFGEDWNELLSARCRQRFAAGLRQLTGGQARSLVEELLQRIAVRRIADRHQPPIPRAEIEAEKELLRGRFFSTEARRHREFSIVDCRFSIVGGEMIYCPQCGAKTEVKETCGDLRERICTNRACNKRLATREDPISHQEYCRLRAQIRAEKICSTGTTNLPPTP